MKKKIAIIGTGKVGSTLAYTLLDRKITNELLLVDKNKKYLEGIRLDLQSAFPFAKIHVKGNIGDCDLIVMTAGQARTAETRTREELFEKNRKVFDNVFSGKKFKENTKIIVVTNPVEQLADYLVKLSGLPKEDVMAFGIQLDSNRLKFLSQDRSARVSGEHGEGMKMAKGFEKYEKEVKEYASKVISLAGATIFGPAKALADEIEHLV